MNEMMSPPNSIKNIIIIILKLIGLAIKGKKFPCVLISPTLKLFSTIGPKISPRIKGARGTSSFSKKSPTKPASNIIYIKVIIIYCIRANDTKENNPNPNNIFW